MSEIPKVKPVDPADAASLVVDAVRRREAAEAIAQSEIAADELWCLSCVRHQKRHVGIIFLGGEPTGSHPIDGTMWTGVREQGSKYFWEPMQAVICKQCLESTGERVPLRVTEVPAPHPSMGHCFIVDRQTRERFVFKLSRKELAKWLPKAETPPEKTDAGRSAKHSPAPAA